MPTSYGSVTAKMSNMEAVRNHDGRCVQLVVFDDHEIVALGIRTAFEQEIEDGRICIKMLSSVRELTEKPDVAILDLRLNDGSTPTENLQHLDALNVPVVYTSGDDPVLVREAITAGTLSVVRKSAPAEELTAAVECAYRGEVSPGLDWAAALDADEDFVQTELSDMEAKVLALYASGELSEAVARRLEIAPSSVNTYVNRIRTKYRNAGRNVDSRVDLFLRAAEDGLVSYFGRDA